MRTDAWLSEQTYWPGKSSKERELTPTPSAFSRARKT